MNASGDYGISGAWSAMMTLVAPIQINVLLLE
jgi:hypothetical protein